MIIYIDLLILSTILVNFVFIKTIALIFKEKLSMIRVSISLILSVLLLLLYFLPYQFYFFIRYFMGIIIGMIAFQKSDIKQKMIKIVIFYLLNMTFIGCLVVFEVKSILPLILTVVYVVVLYLVQNYKDRFKKENENLYDVQLNKRTLKAYLDTGNLATYQNIPIVFIKKKFLNNAFILEGMTAIKSIFEEKKVPLYKGPTLEVKKKLYQVYYVFVDEIEYDIILNNSIGESIHDKTN